MILSESPPSFDKEATPTDSEEWSWQFSAEIFSPVKDKFEVSIGYWSKR